MEEARLLSLPEGIQVRQIQITEQGLLIEVAATAETACCPLWRSVVIDPLSLSARAAGCALHRVPCATAPHRLGIQTTRQTILRRIMALPDPPAESILFLGIDDFSFLRSRRFGTILVNLETRHVVDLLPDRKAETSAAWMRQYPDLMAVSRDRGGDYAAAAKASAPQATEVGR